MKSTFDKEELRRLVAETLDVELSDLTDSADFREELEVDSLMSLEVMVMLEDHFGIKLSQDQMQDANTFSDVSRVLEGTLNENQSNV